VNEYFPSKKEELVQKHYNQVFDSVIAAMVKE